MVGSCQIEVDCDGSNVVKGVVARSRYEAGITSDAGGKGRQGTRGSVGGKSRHAAAWEARAVPRGWLAGGVWLGEVWEGTTRVAC
ncbi:hypothetical protein GUJ93_ZPchr0011g27312 [Zizania palustris]|uniref:Uncharacterized protein n=1 Tax=Zizania palustris TaxID=103762 RepID=A0A8J6BPM2_ZIZPA|nr:hypothetical protein GUJ93_ZPchr0011g27312 [Zizania palustris]